MQDHWYLNNISLSFVHTIVRSEGPECRAKHCRHIAACDVTPVLSEQAGHVLHDFNTGSTRKANYGEFGFSSSEAWLEPSNDSCSS